MAAEQPHPAFAPAPDAFGHPGLAHSTSAHVTTQPNLALPASEHVTRSGLALPASTRMTPQPTLARPATAHVTGHAKHGSAAGATAFARPWREIVADYVQISKPRILFLLLVVAWAAMFVAAAGLPAWRPFVGVTLAGTFSVAASGAFNNVLERHRDARMGRTAGRAVAAGRITVASATAYGIVMSALAFSSLAWFGLWWAAALTLGAIAYYVVVYTVLLKPNTPQNIVVGGFAGSFPALIGWAAVTGGLALPQAWPAVALAALVFLWTPPHFWALALLYKEDYAAADYPMMPNVRGDASTRRQILVYSMLTVAASLALPVLNVAGWAYLACAAALGALLLLRAVSLLRDPGPQRYRSFFFLTIQYLGLLLASLMLDRLLVTAWPRLALA